MTGNRPLELGSPLRSLWRVILYAGLTLPLMAVQAVALWLDRPAKRHIPYWYHRQCCKILGIRVQRRGRKSRRRPTLYVANHASYFDIIVLSSVIHGASFVAKAEIASWPFFGWLAKLQRSVFVERRASRAAEHRDEITRRLEEKDNIIVFPEGTSDDGNRVLPFKSALFSVAERRPFGEPLTVQPVSIAYTRLDGMPMGRALRPFFAWYGDMDLPAHLWEALGLGKLTVVLQFHKPVTIDQFGSRKAMSDYCQAMVAKGVAEALSGRTQEVPESTPVPKTPGGQKAAAAGQPAE